MLKIGFTENDFDISNFEERIWRGANSTAINTYWSGAEAPAERHAAVRLLWSASFLYVRFDAIQKEPLFINKNPDLLEKTDKLWERDVFELFLAPKKDNSQKYFEFEVAPTGEWLDLAIHQMPDKRKIDLKYKSRMKTAAKISDEKICAVIKIPLEAFGKTPKAGDVWLGNLYRILGTGENRGYLAWQPTKTKIPNFHVPEKFGEFHFAL